MLPQEPGNPLATDRGGYIRVARFPSSPQTVLLRPDGRSGKSLELFFLLKLKLRFMLCL